MRSTLRILSKVDESTKAEEEEEEKSSIPDFSIFRVSKNLPFRTIIDTIIGSIFLFLWRLFDAKFSVSIYDLSYNSRNE